MGHTYVIGDVHGCYYSMMALMDRLGPRREDKIVFLGDLINKGPYSKKVIDQLIEWRKQGYQMPSLIGNHELKMLNMIGNEDKGEIDLYWKLYSAKGAYDEFFNEAQKIPDHYLKFFNSLYPYLECEKHILVHAGLDFSLSTPFDDIKSLTTIRDWVEDYRTTVVDGKIIVHGHQNCTLKQTQSAIAASAKVIPLDTGCVYYGKKKGLGYLTALRLEDHALFYQINIEEFT